MFSIKPKYIIAVDFEATCWENQPHSQFRESEIIEFPAVLMNLETGKIEAEFHHYIKPIEKPILSEYCLNLTGITQNAVDNGIPLETALIMFQEWLSKEITTRQLVLPKFSNDYKMGTCVFVSWGNWDFGTCLDKECIRKNIKKPLYFNLWTDIRYVFRGWCSYKPNNFSDALRYVGLKFVGNEHSGLDDARNIAILTYNLVKKGVALKINGHFF
ncbi:3'-5' exonuclease Snipper-like [Calliphora vicina]|uniref:3'-5' exonuclease Snipper-like n=1 Tax=Calliphora vicina TaxID=7373 RepID=UPI00325B08D1